MTRSQKKYSLKERADFYARLASTGKSADGKKVLTAAQKAACIVKAGRLQERATRAAKSYDYYKNNSR